MYGIGTRVSRAFRVRGDGVRRAYAMARRTARVLRDGPRRAEFRRLPSAPFRISEEAGFLVVPPGSFEEVPAIVADAHTALGRYDAAAPVGKSRKRFLVNVQDPGTLSLESPILRFALRDDVLAAVSAYLGVIPFLTTVSVFFSDAVEGDFTSSQLHHCDGDDIRQIKVFIYCTDVDEASGPLTVLDAKASARVRRATGYQYRQRLTDAQVQAVVGTGREYAILGPAGTAAFVDTSRCFHFGSRVSPAAPPRLVTMVQYQTPYSFMLPADAERALPFRGLADPSLGVLQRLALGG